MSKYRYQAAKCLQVGFDETGASVTLDNAAIVNNEDGTITIKSTAHGLAAGSYVRIYGTTNYDGIYKLQTGTGTDDLIVLAVYVAETPAGTEKAYVATPRSPKTLDKGEVMEFDQLQHNPDLTLLTDAQCEADDRLPFRRELNGTLYLPKPAVFDILTIPANAIVLGAAEGGADPARNTTSGMLTFVDDSTDLVYGLFQMPMGYKTGGRIRPSALYLPGDADGGTAGLTFSYKLIKNGAAVPASFTDVLVAETIPASANMKVCDFGEIIIPTLAAGDFLLFTFTRTTKGTTYTAATHIDLYAISLAFEKDAIGAGESNAK